MSKKHYRNSTTAVAIETAKAKDKSRFNGNLKDGRMSKKQDKKISMKPASGRDGCAWDAVILFLAVAALVAVLIYHVWG